MALVVGCGLVVSRAADAGIVLVAGRRCCHVRSVSFWVSPFDSDTNTLGTAACSDISRWRVDVGSCRNAHAAWAVPGTHVLLGATVGLYGMPACMA